LEKYDIPIDAMEERLAKLLLDCLSTRIGRVSGLSSI
jgi:hypothetical protein